MSSWLLALLASSQVPYELLALVLNDARKSGYSSTEKSLLPKDLFSRHFNPSEDLPRTIILNISTRKIETEKRKRDIRRISYSNSNKIPPL